MVVVALGCGEARESLPDRFVDIEAATLSEELRIDGNTADLVPISGYDAPGNAVAVRHDGVIALRQSQDRSIRLYDASGDLLSRVGGRGEGPGEFAGISRIGWLADTLWAYDGRRQRATLFAPAWEVARTLPTPGRARSRRESAMRVPEFGFVRLVELLRDGSLYVALTLSVGQDAPESFRNRTTLARVTLDGIIEEVAARIPIGQVQINTSEGGAVALPFPNRSFEEVSIAAGRLAFALAALESEDAGTILVTAIDLEGDTVFARRYPFDPVPIPDAERDAALARYGGDIPIPPFRPPLTGLIVGRDGTIWVEMIETEEGRPYLVLEPNGDPLATLVMPSSSRIAVAQRDRIWVIERDEFDVESLVRYGVGWR